MHKCRTRISDSQNWKAQTSIKPKRYKNRYVIITLQLCSDQHWGGSQVLIKCNYSSINYSSSSQASTALNWAQLLGISSRNLNILVAAALIGSQHWGMNQFVNWSQPEFRERAGTVVVVSVVVAVVIVVGCPPWLTLAVEFKVWLCPSSASARSRTQGWKKSAVVYF